MTRDPSVESLRVLDACVRHGSFTKAAAELRVTPAAVSARIRNLEADLGTTLFDRHGPRVTPTKAALTLAAKIAESLRLMRSAVEECRAAAPQLRITVVPSFATRWLAPRLVRFQASPDAPQVVLDVSAELRDPTSFDAAIRTGEGRWPGFDVVPLFPVLATPMLRPDIAEGVKTPADFATRPLIPHPDWRRWFDEAGLAEIHSALADEGYPMHDLDAAAALAGAGAALLSPILYGELLSEGRLVRPFPHTLVGPAWHYLLVHRGDERASVARFTEWLVTEAQASLTEEPGGITVR
jgi:LysR family glycine cleavage system transcriptional activator